MAYEKIKIPAGEKITLRSEGVLNVPDHPIITYIEGDGTGPDITAAAMKIWNAAVEKAYGGKRKIAARSTWRSARTSTSTSACVLSGTSPASPRP